MEDREIHSHQHYQGHGQAMAALFKAIGILVGIFCTGVLCGVALQYALGCSA